MNVLDKLNQEISHYRGSIAREEEKVRQLEALLQDLPLWLAEQDATDFSPYADRIRITLRGNVETVKLIQKGTGHILQRRVEEYTGKVFFEGQVGNLDIIVRGDLPLAPGCSLETYETTETVTKFRVNCPEGVEA